MSELSLSDPKGPRQSQATSLFVAALCIDRTCNLNQIHLASAQLALDSFEGSGRRANERLSGAAMGVRCGSHYLLVMVGRDEFATWLSQRQNLIEQARRELRH